MRLRRVIQWCSRLAAAILVTSGALSGSAMAQPAQGINLVGCEGLWFSTSEDFTSRVRVQGGPVISDGDLLVFDGSSSRLCARNNELLRRFDIDRLDHGLDALDQIALGPDFVMAAFSTELDSVHGQFSAGDLLFTNGLIVPNAALLARFNDVRGWDMGLDALHIVGESDRVRILIERLMEVSLEELRENPELLIELLRETDTDIWFSTEGTAFRSSRT